MKQGALRREKFMSRMENKGKFFGGSGVIRFESWK